MTEPRYPEAPRETRRFIRRSDRATKRSVHLSPTSAAGQCPCATAPTSPSTTPCAPPPGLFDISHMAEFLVDRRRTRARSSTTRSPDACRRCAVGKAKYSLVLAESGGIIDDVIVYRLARRRVPRDRERGQPRRRGRRARRARATGRARRASSDATDRYRSIAVQGPAALGDPRRDTDRLDGEFSTAAGPSSSTTRLAHAASAGRARRCSSPRTGYTGEDGFELLVRSRTTPRRLWDALLTGG